MGIRTGQLSKGQKVRERQGKWTLPVQYNHLQTGCLTSACCSLCACSEQCCRLWVMSHVRLPENKTGNTGAGGAQSGGLMLCFIFPLSQTNINKLSSHRPRNHPFIPCNFSHSGLHPCIADSFQQMIRKIWFWSEALFRTDVLNTINGDVFNPALIQLLRQSKAPP